MSDREEQNVDLRFLGTRVQSLTDRMGDLETRFSSLETRFSGLETRFSGLEARFSGMETRLGGIERRLDLIEERNSRILALVVRIAERQGTRGMTMIRMKTIQNRNASSAHAS
jgi:septal ring factor EnvC (AmiA/AmiB activator)